MVRRLRVRALQVRDWPASSLILKRWVGVCSKTLWGSRVYAERRRQALQQKRSFPMRGKILLVVGLGVGYVLGARAGRGRYDEIKRTAQKFWNDPRGQKKGNPGGA